MRKILIATPLKGGVDEHYVQALFNLVSASVPDCKFGFCFVSQTSIDLARCEIAMHVLMNGYDELVFWDKDIRPTGSQFMRLLSHENEDVVCGLYCLRRKDTGWHFYGFEGHGVEPSGLLRVSQCAIGFSKIKASVFSRLAEAFPERAAIARDNGREPRLLHQFFPQGIVGPNSTEGRMDAIKAWFGSAKPSDFKSAADVLDKIRDLLTRKHSDPSCILGEDFFFCRLCLAIGIQVKIDTHLVIPHLGNCEFPIPTAELQEMLKEPWRIEEQKALDAAKAEAAAN